MIFDYTCYCKTVFEIYNNGSYNKQIPPAQHLWDIYSLTVDGELCLNHLTVLSLTSTCPCLRCDVGLKEGEY